MKNLIFTIVIFLCSFDLYSQIKIGGNPTSIQAGSILELESTTQGLSLPRLTSVQRDQQSHWKEGHLIYNVTIGGLEIYDGMEWDKYADSTDIAWKKGIVNGNELYYIGDASTDTVCITPDGDMGVGTSKPQGALDIHSTKGALIVPRMSDIQAEDLSSISGSIIYINSIANNSSIFHTKGFWFNEGNIWVKK